MHFLLWKKGSHQSPNFDTSKCFGENLPNSSYQLPNHKSVFLQTLYDSLVSWKIAPLYFFRSNVIYFAQKEPIKVQIFETFECSCQNEPNCCHFCNNKSVFLQLLHHSSVLWETTALHFLTKNLYTFNKRSLSKYKFGEI